MTQPAIVGYLGVAALVAAAFGVVFLVVAVGALLFDRPTPKNGEIQ